MLVLFPPGHSVQYKEVYWVYAAAQNILSLCGCATVYVLGCRLRVEVEITSTGEWLYAEYDSMTVESETDNYRLQVSGYHGNAGDAFDDDRQADWQSNGMAFSTPDRDNDQLLGGDCAGIRRYGWWFRRCSTSALNGVTSRYWYSAPKPQYPNRFLPIPVSASRMMLQC